MAKRPNTQWTVVSDTKGLRDKTAYLKNLLADKVEDQIVDIATYGIQISPVDTGAYVESMSIRPRGSGAGRMRSSDNREPAPDAQAKKDEAKGLVRSDAAQYKKQIIESGGAVITNRSPHAVDVERKYEVFGRMKDKFR